MDSARAEANAAGWTVGELAQTTGLSQRVLRHWGELGLVTPAGTAAGRRRYDTSEITRLLSGPGAAPGRSAVDDAELLMKVLEHLPRPAEALRRLRAMLRPGGTITVIEGDHGSTYFHPDSPAARDAIAYLLSPQASSRLTASTKASATYCGPPNPTGSSATPSSRPPLAPDAFPSARSSRYMVASEHR